MHGLDSGNVALRRMFILFYFFLKIVQKYIYENKKKIMLCCVFIEKRECFDSIYRHALSLKLYEAVGKNLRITRGMYQKVKSCVRNCGSYSEDFEHAEGF